MRIAVWAPAPNRHLQPLWDAAARSGVLEKVRYAGLRLSWTQLGTPPAYEDAELLQSTATEALAQLCHGVAPVHLVQSVGHPLCLRVMRICAKQGLRCYVIAESLTPRPGWSPRRLVRDAVYRRALGGVQGVFALSPAAALDYAGLGVPRRRIHPGAYAGPAAPSRIESRRRTIVYCGRLVPIKGIDVLCEALLRLAARSADFAVEVAGEGPDARLLHRLGPAGVRCTMLGALSSTEVARLLSEASVLVLPSRRWEGWGYVVNEALAAGVPVVVSDVVGARELVVRGRTGYVFRQEDASDLAEKLEAAVRLRGSDGCSQALRRMHQGIDPDAVLGYMLDVMTGDGGRARGVEAAPWLRAAEELGGNPELDWWREWKAAPDGARS